MFRIDNKGQSSAEIILIIGGLLVIVLFVASYITNIINTTQNSFDGLINSLLINLKFCLNIRSKIQN